MQQIVDDAELVNLLTSVALDLRLPLLQIKTKVEQALDAEEITTQTLQSLGLSAETGLHMLEAYLLSTTLHQAMQLQLEPLSIGVILEDVAHRLTGYAKAYDAQVVVDLPKKAYPVLTHRRSSLAIFTCLAESLIRAEAKSDQSNTIVLGAHNSGQQVVAGVYGLLEGLSSKALQTARNLSGKAEQPLTGLPMHSIGGILVADQLSSLIADPLKPSKHSKLAGLATQFNTSGQMSLIA